MHQRYEKPTIRSDILRQRLKQIKFEGPSQMIEYCTAFRTIEQQLQDMHFEDKLRNFMRALPINDQIHIKLMDLGAKDMDTVYQAAHQWAQTLEGACATRPRH